MTLTPDAPATICAHIRMGHADDVDAFVQLQTDAFTGRTDGEVVDWELAQYARGLVAEVDGRVIGTVSTIVPGAPRYAFERYVSLDDPRLPADLARDNTSEIDSLVVHPAFRGNRFGVALAAAIPFLQRGLGARYVVGVSAPMGRGVADKMGAREIGVQVPMNTWVEHVACAPISENCAHAAPILDELIADRRITLGPIVDKLVRGETVDLPAIDWSAE